MFRLMLVTDRNLAKRSLEETVRRALDGGVDAVQLRERDLEAKDLFALAERLRQITSDARASLIINHRTDVALAVAADGVQLGWRSVRVAEARRLGGEALRIGVSCHNEEDVRQAESDGADYVILGPVFPTPSKEGLVEPLGLRTVRDIVRTTTLPIVAVGGIKPENVASVRETGVPAVAVIAAIIASDDPTRAARAL